MLSQIDHKGFFLTVLWLNSKWLLTNRIWRRRGELVYISIHITYIGIHFFSLNMYKLFLVLIPSLILLLLLEPEQWKLLRFDFRFKNSKYSKSSLVINSIFWICQSDNQMSGKICLLSIIRAATTNFRQAKSPWHYHATATLPASCSLP